jgi:hypothetical protein
MSYYYSLTEKQIQERKLAFDSVYHFEDGIYVMKTSMPATKELNLIADYIGYLIYRSNCKQRKYREKEINVIDYLSYFRNADRTLAGLISSIGMEEIKEINPLSYRMMERFIRLGDGI